MEETKLDDVAAGRGFDVVLAVRVLATELINLQVAVNGLLPAQPESTLAPSLAEALGNSRLAGVLARAGLATPEAVRAATDDDLLNVAGVTDKGLAQIREKLA